jgi:hypothetical protein
MPSTSTIAMISAALATAAGRAKTSILARHVEWQPEEKRRSRAQNEKTVRIIHQGLELILKQAKEAITEKQRWTFRSGTFGVDDVFTLCWLAELQASVAASSNQSQEEKAKEQIGDSNPPTPSSATGTPSPGASLAEVFAAVLENRSELKDRTPAKLLEGNLFQTVRDDNTLEPLGSEHAFPLLRALQLKRWAEKPVGDQTLSGAIDTLGALQESVWQAEFSRRLHEQISFHSIPDSRFDPAELAFALEGLAVSRPSSLDPAVVTRSLDVLAIEQERNPTLRPSRPIKADPAGSALFPVAVEIFNSLLRTGAIVGQQFGQAFVRAQLVKLSRRYYSWVRPRLVIGGVGRDDVYGWHSEHINDPRLVHPWETSQILLFLLGYRTLLDRHLAAESLHVAGLSVRESDSRATPQDAEIAWEKLVKSRDPLLRRRGALGSELAVYEAIQREFVFDHARGQPVRYSMILYGPPGTGKTNLAEELAKALGYPLITVTVSDFLAEGGLQIEARAKAVFAVLAAQKKSVIIFDEIDHLLLNRSSDEYGRADSSIQLMVPGMLTKIKDLRSVERSIFIVATNYEERIDGAIKRPGRIDRKYLVMPPDWGRRETILRRVLSDYSKDVYEINPEVITTAASSKTLLAKTARMSFPEISAVLYDILALVRGGGDLISKIESYSYPEPVAELIPYLGRVGSSQLLQEELDALLDVAREAVDKSESRFDLGLETFEQEKRKRDQLRPQTPGGTNGSV